MTTQSQISVPVIVKPEEGSAVSVPVNISGTGEPGATVEVADASGVQRFSSVVDPAGLWRGQVNFPKGLQRITALQRREDSTSAWSPNRTFTVD